ncbi:carbohydrate ABC transporter permease [Allostreptomyces psammosilenae]|uniref:Multiple sugar transport system permease protein n=1 Tax=Allostreptomyces psammosilenae TaxID=1892865 RepID=A0A852ZP74_9ACTN|nr:multiple sugar transport system permease protein [Allostreptomyces psammosilenae]
MTTLTPGAARTTAGYPDAPTSRRPVGERVWNIVGLLVTAFVAFLWLLPLLWAADTSLKSEGETTQLPLRWIPESGFTLDAYRAIIEQGDLLRWFANSTVIAVAVTVLTLAIVALAAYGFSRTDFRGKGLVYAIVIAGLMVPPQVLIVPLFQEMTAFGLLDTYWAVILPQLAAPSMVYILKRFFDSIPPELEEAARMDGAGPLTIFLRIVLPLSRSVLVAVGIFTFIGAWNNFLWPFIATTNPDLMTIPVGLANVSSGYGLMYARIMASAVLGGLPLLILFVIFQRQIVRGVAHTGLGGT